MQSNPSSARRTRLPELTVYRDSLIYLLLQDPKYRVKPDGTVWTCVQLGRKPAKDKEMPWRQTAKGRSNGYAQLKYKRKMLSVHRIVFAAFCQAGQTLDPNLVINHINGIRDDNRIENLELVTGSANIRHAYTHLGVEPLSGENRPSSKLTDLTVSLIREEYATGLYTQHQIAQKYGVDQSNVSAIVLFKTWRHAKAENHPAPETATPRLTNTENL